MNTWHIEYTSPDGRVWATDIDAPTQDDAQAIFARDNPGCEIREIWMKPQP